MSEPVVDYLTRWSGIKPGDLDPGVSMKHLTTLKNSYSKLLLLELRGVTFVGHGLPKDFRVINTSPAKDQVADTVDLYRLPNQRKMSLKSVASAWLGEPSPQHIVADYWAMLTGTSHTKCWDSRCSSLPAGTTLSKIQSLRFDSMSTISRSKLTRTSPNG